jgi:seryl-tRNA synthetase
MFLNKKNTKINPYQNTKISKLKDYSRKHKTYIKFKLAKISSSTTTLDAQAQEVSNALQQILTKLWNLDNSLILLPWNDGNNTTPLKRTMEFPRNQNALSVYLDRLWLEAG